MFFIKYGIANTPIGVDEYLVKCPSCENEQLADVIIISNYYHFCYVPIFPVGKEVNISCKRCGLKRYGASLHSEMFVDYRQHEKKYRHPWFTYIGITLLASPFLVGLVLLVFE